MAKQIDILGKLTAIQAELAKLAAIDDQDRTSRKIEGAHVDAETLSRVGRALDGIAEQAAFLRGCLDYGAHEGRRDRLVRRVRKALGYTIP